MRNGLSFLAGGALLIGAAAVLAQQVSAPPADTAPWHISTVAKRDTARGSSETAQTEAARCLDCDQMCSICTSVCPNLAFLTYQLTPFAGPIPALKASGGKFEISAEPFAVRQELEQTNRQQGDGDNAKPMLLRRRNAEPYQTAAFAQGAVRTPELSGTADGIEDNVYAIVCQRPDAPHNVFISVVDGRGSKRGYDIVFGT